MGTVVGIETSNRLLWSLLPPTRASVKACGVSVELERGAVLFSANQTIDSVWFIDHGVVSASHHLCDGAELEVALIGTEGMVGAVLALGTSVTPVVWRVCVAGTAIRVARADFLHLLAEHSDLRAVVLGFASVFIRQVSQAAACAAKHTISQRLARWILTCHAKAGQRDLEITHQSLACALGVRRAGVTEALHTLEGAQAIRSVRGRIILKDVDTLRSLSCGCATEFSMEAGSSPRPRVKDSILAPIGGVLQCVDLARR